MPRASPAKFGASIGRRTETGDSRDGGPCAGGCADCGPRAGAVQLCLDRLPGAPAALVSPDQPVAGGGGEPAGGVAGCGGRLLRGPVRHCSWKKSQQAIQRLQEQLGRNRAISLLNQIRSHFFYHTPQRSAGPDRPEAGGGLQNGRRLRPLPAVHTGLRHCRRRDRLPSGRRSGRSGPMRISTSSRLGTGRTWSTRFPDVDFPIPLLTIQPIVENAILHGIKPKVGGGTVSLKLEERRTTGRSR